MSLGSSGALLLVAVASGSAVPRPGPTAPPLALDLQLEAPAACPGRASLSDEITRFMGPIALRADGVRVHGRITPVGEGWVLELELGTTPVERRRVEAHDCVVLVRAAALMTAVALEPVETSAQIGAWVERPPAAVVVAAATEAADAPSSSRSVAPPPTAAQVPRRRHPPQFVAAAHGGVGVGFAPRTTGVVHGELGIGGARWQVSIGGLHGFATTRTVARDIGIRASTSAVTLHALARVRAGSVALELGAGVEAGAIVGAGTGRSVAAKAARAPWVAVVGRAGLTWPRRGRIAVGTHVDAVVATTRPGIALQRIGGPETVFRTPPVSLRALAGVVVRLP